MPVHSSASVPHLPDAGQLALQPVVGHEISQVPTPSFRRCCGLRPRRTTASCIAMPHMLPSTVPSISASAKLLLAWLNPPPHAITVYASHPPSPTTAQHSLPGGALPPYRGRSFTGRIASASPDAPEPSAQSISLHRRACKPLSLLPWRFTGSRSLRSSSLICS